MTFLRVILFGVLALIVGESVREMACAAVTRVETRLQVGR